LLIHSGGDNKQFIYSINIAFEIFIIKALKQLF